MYGVEYSKRAVGSLSCAGHNGCVCVCVCTDSVSWGRSKVCKEKAGSSSGAKALGVLEPFLLNEGVGL